jgi:hypothetical protein
LRYELVTEEVELPFDPIPDTVLDRPANGGIRHDDQKVGSPCGQCSEENGEAGPERQVYFGEVSR